MKTPLYHTSFLDLLAPTQLLLIAGADVNEECHGSYSSALQAASAIGREAIVGLLLDAGADVDIYGGYCGTTLQAASARRHEAIVSLLLDAGADVNTNGGHYGTATRELLETSSLSITILLLLLLLQL
jgi:ankyrin repeat protein